MRFFHNDKSPVIVLKFKFGSRNMWAVHEKLKLRKESSMSASDYVPKKKNRIHLSINKYQ